MLKVVGGPKVLRRVNGSVIGGVRVRTALKSEEECLQCGHKYEWDIPLGTLRKALVYGIVDEPLDDLLKIIKGIEALESTAVA